MLRSKTFLRKTRRGRIVKIVREHYLRDDIWCGFPSCESCQQENVEENIMLQNEPKRRNKLVSAGHILIPDTNVILHQVCKLIL